MGIFFGFNHPLNSSAEEVSLNNSTLGLSLLLDQSPSSSISVEYQLWVAKINKGTFTQSNDFESTLLTFNVIPRYYFLHQDHIANPYLGIGLGFSYYYNYTLQNHLQQDFIEFSGFTFTFPFFVGTTIPISKYTHLDIHTGVILTTSDKIFPLQDGSNDELMYLRIGINTPFPSFSILQK